MPVWKNIDPVGAIADFRSVWQQAGKNRWWFAILAASATFALFSLMFEEHRIAPRAPKITFISSWRADRTDAEIIASNKANEIYQQQVRAEQARREEEVRQIYVRLGRATGVNVDAIEAEAKAERAAAEAARNRAASTQAEPQSPADPQDQAQSQSQAPIAKP